MESQQVLFPSSKALLVGGCLVITYALIRCTYLLFWHPLAKFPGPKLAAVSNVWYGYQWLSGRYPWGMQKALQSYGDVVRVAPNELVFITPEAYTDIYTATIDGRPAFVKTDLLDTGDKYEGLASERNIDKHRTARKQLAPAFSPANLQAYLPTINTHVEGFISSLESSAAMLTEGMDISLWLERMACDLGGAITLNHSFDQVGTRTNHPVLDSLLRIGHWGTVRNVLRRFPLVYPLSYLVLPPKTLLSYVRAHTACKNLVKRRVEMRHEIKTLDYLAQFVKDDKSIPPLGFLSSQAGHLVLDHFESSSVFSAGVYFLTTNPMSMGRLQKELRENFGSLSGLTDQSLQRLPWLNACITEILRIHTNVPYGLPRISPGYSIDGHYVPKGSVVSSCAYATTHSPRYFAEPYEFAPQRWLPVSDTLYEDRFSADDKAAFRPFSVGSRNCLGQAMAQIVLRAVMAKLFWRFDWELLNKNDINWDRDLRLFMVWQKPPLQVRLTCWQGQG